MRTTTQPACRIIFKFLFLPLPATRDIQLSELHDFPVGLSVPLKEPAVGYPFAANSEKPNPGVSQNIALRASPAAWNSIILISASPVHAIVLVLQPHQT